MTMSNWPIQDPDRQVSHRPNHHLAIHEKQQLVFPFTYLWQQFNLPNQWAWLCRWQWDIKLENDQLQARYCSVNMTWRNKMVSSHCWGYLHAVGLPEIINWANIAFLMGIYKAQETCLNKCSWWKGWLSLLINVESASVKLVCNCQASL